MAKKKIPDVDNSGDDPRFDETEYIPGEPMSQAEIDETVARYDAMDAAESGPGGKAAPSKPAGRLSRYFKPGRGQK